MRSVLLIVVFLFSFTSVLSQTIDPNDWPGLVGYWSFDDAADIEHASVGNDLELFGSQIPVSGPTATDGATRIGNNAYYKCTHDINANGSGSKVNEYTLVIDFKIPESGQYYCFYQTSTDNTNDGEIFVNPTGHIGVSATYYTNCTIDSEEWYRLVIAVDLGNTFQYFIDGNLVLDGASQGVDGRFSLDTFFHWFRDDNNEDNEFDIAAVGIFDYTLTDTEVSDLGGYGHVFPEIPVAGTDPYLQSPKPTSIYVSWHSDQTTTSFVDYGTTTSFGQQTVATYENISGKIWHTAKLEGLTPNTEYFYRCTSGDDVSDIAVFKTLNTPENTQHVRFLLLGDSRTDIYRTSIISQTAEQQIIETYGTDWQNEIDFVMHVGDVVQTDAIQNYVNEFFTPYSNLSKKIPFMISVGNHEYNGGALNFYKYMKYEDLTGTPYEVPSDFNEKFYRFQIGNCLFISLNTNNAMAVSEQLDWLEIILDMAEDDDTIDFIFPFAHHPGHSEIWPDGNNNFVQNSLFELFKNSSKISMYSYGHSHAYERGVLRLNESNSNYQHDAHLLLTGGAGSALDRWGMYNNQEDFPEIHMTFDYYVYSIVDVDVANKSWNIKTYSLGNSDKVLENELIDEWYYNQYDAKPNKPTAISIEDQGTDDATLIASTFSGTDALMTSQFQITESQGDYSSPILDITRDWHNLYGDSGAPDYNPTDLNDGIDLTKLKISNVLSNTIPYYWRVRYKDFNLKWSDWSEEANIDILSDFENIETSISIQIVPNPTDKYIGIRYKLNKAQEVGIRLYDTTGRLITVLSKNSLQQAGSYSFNSKVGTISRGLYFVVFNLSGERISKLVVIK